MTVCVGERKRSRRKTEKILGLLPRNQLFAKLLISGNSLKKVSNTDDVYIRRLAHGASVTIVE